MPRKVKTAGPIVEATRAQILEMFRREIRRERLTHEEPTAHRVHMEALQGQLIAGERVIFPAGLLHLSIAPDPTARYVLDGDNLTRDK